MIKWEYKIVHQTDLNNIDQWNALGMEGWENCHFHDSTGCFVFKRHFQEKQVSHETLEAMLHGHVEIPHLG